METGTIEL